MDLQHSISNTTEYTDCTECTECSQASNGCRSHQEDVAATLARNITPTRTKRPFAEVEPAGKKLKCMCNAAQQHILTHIMGLPLARPFLEPVPDDEEFAPGYYDVIKDPQDLGTIHKRVLSGEIATGEALRASFATMIRNARTYNPPGHAVHKQAVELDWHWRAMWRDYDSQHAMNTMDAMDAQEAKSERLRAVPSLQVEWIADRAIAKVKMMWRWKKSSWAFLDVPRIGTVVLVQLAPPSRNVTIEIDFRDVRLELALRKGRTVAWGDEDEASLVAKRVGCWLGSSSKRTQLEHMEAASEMAGAVRRGSLVVTTAASLAAGPAEAAPAIALPWV